MAADNAACECGRTPPSLVYVCEHCPRLTDAERAEWRRLQGYEPVAAPGFKQLGKHSDGCWGHDAGGFYCADGRESRTKTGRKGGSMWWYRFLCNDPDCDAVALVRADVLAAFVTRGVEPNGR